MDFHGWDPSRDDSNTPLHKLQESMRLKDARIGELEVLFESTHKEKEALIKSLEEKLELRAQDIMLLEERIRTMKLEHSSMELIKEDALSKLKRQLADMTLSHRKLEMRLRTLESERQELSALAGETPVETILYALKLAVIDLSKKTGQLIVTIGNYTDKEHVFKKAWNDLKAMVVELKGEQRPGLKWSLRQEDIVSITLQNRQALYKCLQELAISWEMLPQQNNLTTLFEEVITNSEWIIKLSQCSRQQKDKGGTDCSPSKASKSPLAQEEMAPIQFKTKVTASIRSNSPQHTTKPVQSIPQPMATITNTVNTNRRRNNTPPRTSSPQRSSSDRKSSPCRVPRVATLTPRASSPSQKSRPKGPPSTSTAHITSTNPPTLTNHLLENKLINHNNKPIQQSNVQPSITLTSHSPINTIYPLHSAMPSPNEEHNKPNSLVSGSLPNPLPSKLSPEYSQLLGLPTVSINQTQSNFGSYSLSPSSNGEPLSPWTGEPITPPCASVPPPYCASPPHPLATTANPNSNSISSKYMPRDSSTTEALAPLRGLDNSRDWENRSWGELNNPQAIDTQVPQTSATDAKYNYWSASRSAAASTISSISSTSSKYHGDGLEYSESEDSRTRWEHISDSESSCGYSSSLTSSLDRRPTTTPTSNPNLNTNAGIMTYDASSSMRLPSFRTNIPSFSVPATN